MGITCTMGLLVSPNAQMGLFNWCHNASPVTANARHVKSLSLTVHRAPQEATSTRIIVSQHALH